MLSPIRQARPDAAYVYIGDTACFPYGELPEQALIDRVTTVITTAAERVRRRMIWNSRVNFGSEVIGSSGLSYAA